MERPFSVAIDGPAGAGKSTIAKAAARRFGLKYVDTGAIYRTLGLGVLRAGASCKDAEAVSALLPEIDIGIEYDDAGMQHMLLFGEDVSDAIRTQEIAMCASCVSAMSAVRAHLLDMQRELAKRVGVVMDGRDIATVVLPEADVKIFLTASSEKRAERRYAELIAKGAEANFDDVLRETRERDEQDSKRAAAPLKMAEGAVLVDTSAMSLDESIEAVCAVIARAMEVEEG